MLTPSSSPARPRLLDLTNAHLTPSLASPTTPSAKKNQTSIPTPPGSTKRRLSEFHGPQRKRTRIELESDESEESSSDTDEEEVAITRMHMKRRPGGPAGILNAYGRRGQLDFPLHQHLRTYATSYNADTLKCQSIDMDSFLTPPYACAYSYGAKRGAKALLAVATEQGTIHIWDSCKRNPWDQAPLITSLQPHRTGVFHVGWNHSDTRIASCSGDQSTRISCPETGTILHSLRGHTGTVKTATWNPHHPDLLSTGGRDGSICTWDLRIRDASMDIDGQVPVLAPVATLPGVHEISLKLPKGRPKKGQPETKSVTGLLYDDREAHRLISSGCADGVLRSWDLRFMTHAKITKMAKTKAACHLASSHDDSTLSHGARRARGIVNIQLGSGPTSGLIFALGQDSRIHTYSLATLDAQPSSYVHPNLQISTFYVGMAISPCGRFIASGSVGTTGSTYLFDVSRAGQPFVSTECGIELHGQRSEIGGVDWGHDMLATCADEGTVHVYRPNAEMYSKCIEGDKDARMEWGGAFC